jgi:uncharacterized protein
MDDPANSNELLNELTEVESGFNQLDEKYVLNETASGFITMAVVAILAAGALLVLWLFRGIDWVAFIVLAIAAVLILLIGFAACIWSRWFFRNARWKLDEESFEIRQGVLWKHRILVPLGRVQHADVSQGPLQRYFGLGKLIVHTAGTYQASVELDGLSHRLALQIRDRLIKQTHQLSEPGA